MKNVTGPIGIGFSGVSNSNNPTPNPIKPFIRNVVFNGIRASVVEKPVNHPDIAWDVNGREGEKNSCITLNAMGEYYLENISFTDVHVKYAGGGTAEQAAKRDVPKVAAEYFGVWDPAPGGPPAYGMYARNVKGLTLHNVRFEYENNDVRPAVIFDNVEYVSVTGLSIQGNPATEAIRLINSKDVLLTACRLLSPAASFLSIEGASTGGITVDGGDLRKAAKPLVFQYGGQEQGVKLRV
jgi:hypothetical protein